MWGMRCVTEDLPLGHVMTVYVAAHTVMWGKKNKRTACNFGDASQLKPSTVMTVDSCSPRVGWRESLVSTAHSHLRHRSLR